MTGCSCGPDAHMRQNKATVQILAMQFVNEPETWAIFKRWVEEVSNLPEPTASQLIKREIYKYVISETARDVMSLTVGCDARKQAQENSP